MSQTKVNFGCCDRQTSSTNILCCHSCKRNYHLSCVNINKGLKDLSEEFKAKWICSYCRKKVPKTDRSRTPIKSVVYQHSPSGSVNVNPRRGGQFEQNTSSDAPIESIRQVVREELETILEDLKSNILKQFDLKTNELLDSFKRLSDSLITIEKEQEIIQRDIKSNASQIALLESENARLRDTVTDLNSRLSRMEQHSRATNLEFQNIPERKSENLINIAKQIATVTNYKLNESDIHLCTRVAKLRSDSRRPKSVVIKFSSPKIRDDFLAATLRFNKKANTVTDKLNSTHLGISGEKSPVFVVEHLSPTQKALHAAARIRARELNYKFVWVKGGRIFMRKTEKSEYKLIKSAEELSQLP